jgi:predicted PurR-regulated permease PerM
VASSNNTGPIPTAKQLAEKIIRGGRRRGSGDRQAGDASRSNAGAAASASATGSTTSVNSAASTSSTPERELSSDAWIGEDARDSEAERAAKRPPRWLPRALVYCVIAVFVGIICWRAFGQLSAIIQLLVVTVVLVLVIEPVVAWLVRHRVNRRLAAGICIVGLILIVAALVAIFGGIFVQQVSAFFNSLPAIYLSLVAFAKSSFGYQLPPFADFSKAILKYFGADSSSVSSVATFAINAAGGLVMFIIYALAMILLVYYISASGRNFRRVLFSYLPARRRDDADFIWQVTQEKVSQYMFSMVIMTLISAAFHSILLMCLGTPYWLPLALFVGIVAQFIPVIGVYIAGAVPALVLLGNHGLVKALVFLIVMIIFQQISGMVLLPQISQKTLQLNPGVSFLMVLVFSAVFGVIGAFLALPATAIFQALFQTYWQRRYGRFEDDTASIQPVKAKKSSSRKAGDGSAEATGPGAEFSKQPGADSAFEASPKSDQTSGSTTDKTSNGAA